MEDPERKKYTLKNGAEVDAVGAIAVLRSLEDLFEREPHYFRALLAIVQGRGNEVTPGAIAALTEGAFLLPSTGAVCADIPDILLSAYQETPEGPVLINPFNLENPADAKFIESVEQDGLKRLIQKLREDDGKDCPPSR